MENKTDETQIVIDIKNIKNIEHINDEDIRFNNFYKSLEQKALCFIVTAFIAAVILVFTQAITSDE